MPKKKVTKKKGSQEKVGFAGARVERIIRDMGAFRVSADAITSLNEAIAQRGMAISKYAVEIASHAGRKTIKESDIRLAETKV